MSKSIRNVASSLVPLLFLVLSVDLLALHFITLCVANRMDLKVGFSFSPQSSYAESRDGQFLGANGEYGGMFMPILSTSNFTKRTEGFSFGMLAADQTGSDSVYNLYLCLCRGQLNVQRGTLNQPLDIRGRSDNTSDQVSGYPVVASLAVPIWNANINRPLTSVKASLTVREDNALELRDVDGSLLWNVSNVAAMEILESGKLIIYNSTNGTIWQSSDHLGDTFLNGQLLNNEMKLTSNNSLYSVALELGDGLYFNFHSQAVFGPTLYWVLHNNFSCVNFLTVTFGRYRQSSCNESLSDYSYDDDEFDFVRLDNDGRLRVYYQSEGYTEPESTFDGINIPTFPYELWGSCDVPMNCGPYSICSPRDGQCACPSSGDFSPIVSADSSQGCQHSLSLPECGVQDGLEFLEINHTSTILLISGATFNTTPTAEDCKHSCMSNCSCTAVFYDRNSTFCFPIQGGISLLNLTDNKANLTSANYVTYLKIAQKASSQPAAPSIGSASSVTSSSRFIVGVAVSSVLLFLALVAMATYGRALLKNRRAKGPDEAELFRLLPSLPTRFSYRELHTATQGFNKMLGAGGCGSVYAGALSDGREIAVKTLDSIVGGNMTKSFLAEVATIGQTSHFNVVRLIGFCWETSHQLLIYEYMEKGSLDRWLFNVADEGEVLDWATRFHVVIGIARGLTYLHDECLQPILHLDIKPQNILLDQSFEPKLADFGMSRFLARDVSQVVTVARGTPGYIAPELFLSEGAVSKKCDVYSLGMVLLEIVGGRKNVDVPLMMQSVNGEQTAKMTTEEEWYYPSWVARMHEEGKMLDVVDKRLNCAFSREEASRTIEVALWCIQENPRLRPSAGAVSKWLEGAIPLDQPPVFSIAYSQSRVKHSISLCLQDADPILSSDMGKSSSHVVALLENKPIEDV